VLRKLENCGLDTPVLKEAKALLDELA